MKRNAMVVIALLIGVQLFAPSVQGAEKKVGMSKGNVVPVLKTQKEVNLKDINDPVWREAEVKEFALTSVPPVHSSVSGTASIDKIAVQGVMTKRDVLFRLSWEDKTLDNEDRMEKFSDKVAIQFPLDKKTDTSIFMGGGGKAVNIWQWVASKNKAENYLSDGFGTLTRADTQYLVGTAEYKDGRWTVLISRPVGMAGKGDILLDKKVIPVAFAVWNGGNQERNGLKAATMDWVNLQIK